MATKKAKREEPKPTFDLSQYREQRRYVWREIEREDAEPLRVKLQRLNMREADGLVFEASTKMEVINAAVAPFVVEWNFRAVNLLTDEEIDVPPPCEVGGEVLELLDAGIGLVILGWLKSPGTMDRITQKKDSTSSENGEPPPSDTD